MSLIKLPKTTAVPAFAVDAGGIGLGLRAQANLVIGADLLILGVFLTFWDLPALFAVLMFALIGLLIATSYLGRPRLALSALDDLPQLAARVMVATALIASGAAMAGLLEIAVDLLVIGTLATIPLFLARSLMYSLLRRVRRSGFARDDAVIVGSGEVADFIHARLRDQPEFGLRVIGYADSAPAAGSGAVNPSGLEVLPQVSDLRNFPGVLDGTGVTTVVFAYSREREAALLPFVRMTAAAGYRTYVVPRFFEAASRAGSDSVWGLPLTHVSSPRRRMQRLMKRSFDVAVAGMALLALSPIIAVIALVLPRETGGKLLFRQVRIGEGGRQFELLKFQTMKPEVGEADVRWNIANDERLGRFGKFLRKTSLDEIPQFWNVLRGDMSLVGPRPERPHFVDMFSKQLPHYADRHRVPVGLTGWAQIHRLRGDTSIDDRARFDNIYCDNWSIWEDMKIIVRTIPEVLRSSGG